MATMYLVTSEYTDGETTFINGVYTTIPLARAAAWEVLSDDMDRIVSVHPVEPDKPIEGGLFWYDAAYRLRWHPKLGGFQEMICNGDARAEWVEVEDERA